MHLHLLHSTYLRGPENFKKVQAKKTCEKKGINFTKIKLYSESKTLSFMKNNFFVKSIHPISRIFLSLYDNLSANGHYALERHLPP